MMVYLYVVFSRLWNKMQFLGRKYIRKEVVDFQKQNTYTFIICSSFPSISLALFMWILYREWFSFLLCITVIFLGNNSWTIIFTASFLYSIFTFTCTFKYSNWNLVEGDITFCWYIVSHNPVSLNFSHLICLIVVDRRWWNILIKRLIYQAMLLLVASMSHSVILVQSK